MTGRQGRRRDTARRAAEDLQDLRDTSTGLFTPAAVRSCQHSGRLVATIGRSRRACFDMQDIERAATHEALDRNESCCADRATDASVRYSRLPPRHRPVANDRRQQRAALGIVDDDRMLLRTVATREFVVRGQFQPQAGAGAGR